MKDQTLKKTRTLQLFGQRPEFQIFEGLWVVRESAKLRGRAVGFAEFPERSQCCQQTLPDSTNTLQFLGRRNNTAKRT